MWDSPPSASSGQGPGCPVERSSTVSSSQLSSSAATWVFRASLDSADVLKWELLFPGLTRIVRLRDGFWHLAVSAKRYNKTRVLLVIESKGIIGRLIGTKVTMGFGPASAIIMPDCFIREQKRNSTKVKNEGENRDAETEGFLTNRVADRGGNHPDHCSYCYS
jgi:hypothetical protein